MSYIERDVTLNINGKTAKFDDMVYIFKGDRDIQLNIKIIDTKMKFSRTNLLGNVLTPLPKGCYARVGLVKPKGGAPVIRDRVKIEDDKVKFLIDSTVCDELDEVGIHKIQIQIYALDDDTSPRWTLPSAAELEVCKPDVDFDNITPIVGLAKAGISMALSEGDTTIVDFNPDGTYNKTTWSSGDVISAEKLNKIENVLDHVVTNKVEKEDGKVLSSNDFTDDYKAKIDENSSQIKDIAIEKADKNSVRMKNTFITEYDISDTLKQQINGNAPILQTIEDNIITPTKTTFIKPGINLFNKNSSIDGKYVDYLTGELIDNVNYIASDYIRIEPAKIYTFIYFGNAHFAFYDESKKFIGVQSYNNSIPNTFTAPNDAYYIRLSIQKSNHDINKSMIVEGSTLSAYQHYEEKLLKEFIPTFSFSEIDGIDENIVEYTSNLFNKNSFGSGYILFSNGGVGSHSNYIASDYIKVEPSTTYCFQDILDQHFAFYDESKKFIGVQSYNNRLTNPFTTPNDAYYIRLTLSDSSKLDTAQFEKGETCGIYEECGLKIKEDLLNNYLNKHYIENILETDTTKVWSSVYSSDLSSILKLEYNNIMKNQIIIFNANIISFESLKIGHGTIDYGSNYITIDNTNIIAYNYKGEVLKTINHNLTLSDFINIQIETNAKNQGKVTIITSTGMFTSELIDNFVANNGEVFVENLSSSLNNCLLKYSCKDYSKKIYAYGDSYFNNTNTSRWTSYVMNAGYDNWLLDGYAGRNSQKALQSLLSDLEHGTPKYLLWCMGMNDADSDSTVNPNWKNALDTVINICNSKKIELILCTIPNVAGNGTTEQSRNHNFKNEHIKSLGYRYIDFADVVGAYNNNSWHKGMLSTDGVHPTSCGAKALFSRAIVDFPEILNI